MSDTCGRANSIEKLLELMLYSEVVFHFSILVVFYFFSKWCKKDCYSIKIFPRFWLAKITHITIVDTYLTRVRVLLYAVALHCGTRYLIAVLARPTAQVPRWAGNVSGGPGSIPGRFWRTGVPSFRRCSTEPLHSGSVKYRDVVRPLHWPLHYQVRVEGAWKKKKTHNDCLPVLLSTF